MNWLVDLINGTGATPAHAAAVATGHTVLILGLVAAIGLQLGHIRVYGVSLGVAGVLFVGLVFGHFGFTFDHSVLEFARDFGLILFVYTIGLQIGPGFAASLRKQGLPLNIMASAIVLLGAVITVVAGKLFLAKSDFPAVVGVFSGATTNTPSLAAATQALTSLSGISPDAAKLPSLGYAVAYPFGVVGIILAMYLIRWIFHVDLKKEADELAGATDSKKLEAVSFKVTNPELDGLTLDELAEQYNSEVVVSRVMSGNKTEVAVGSRVISQGDVLIAVGPPDDMDKAKKLFGDVADVDPKAVPSEVEARYVLVTQRSAVGKSIPSLDLTGRFPVAITRIARGDVELTPTSSTPLVFGDRVRVVGNEEAINAVGKVLGDSVERRDHPMLAPMFLGIALGIVLGSIPISLPGMPAPVKLGLAGGPLIAAILLGRLGSFGPFVWYMPRSANLSVRKLGIVLFLSCVGIKAGDQFVQTLVHGHGLQWMAWGVAITLIPLMIVAVAARIATKLNYMPLCGLLAGSMTDPPALAFAGSVTGSEAPSVAYASVYPLVMILRILAAQAMILFFR